MNLGRLFWWRKRQTAPTNPATLSAADEAALAIIAKRFPKLADHLRKNPF